MQIKVHIFGMLYIYMIRYHKHTPTLPIYVSALGSELYSSFIAKPKSKVGGGINRSYYILIVISTMHVNERVNITFYKVGLQHISSYCVSYL